MKKAELKTIKVLPTSIDKLNRIAKQDNLCQYEVVDRLATTEIENRKKKNKK